LIALLVVCSLGYAAPQLAVEPADVSKVKEGVIVWLPKTAMPQTIRKVEGDYVYFDPIVDVIFGTIQVMPMKKVKVAEILRDTPQPFIK
jgi:hypothetical protein